MGGFFKWVEILGGGRGSLAVRAPCPVVDSTQGGGGDPEVNRHHAGLVTC